MSEDRAGDPPELIARFTAYRQTGDRAQRNALVTEHRSIAEAIAWRFAHRGEPLADLEQVAMLGLVKAVERFDPSKGIPFAGYAVPTITGELRRHFRDATWSVKVTRRAKELHVKVLAVVDQLTGTLGRSPTPPELARELGVTVDEVLDALDAGAAYRTTSTDTPEGAAAARHAVEGSIDPDSRLSPEDRLLARRLLASLDERDRRIVALRFFSGLSQSEIAAEVGISQVHVSRLLRRALREMRREADPGPPSDVTV